MEKINNIIYYLLMMGLFFFFAFYYHSYTLFILFIAMLIFPFFSIAIIRYISKKLSFSIEIDHYYCHTEKQYKAKITVHNPTILPVISCNLEIAINNFYYPNDMLQQINLSVPAFSSEEIIIPISFKYCGCYTVEIKKAEVKDLLAFIKKEIIADALYQFNVFPIAEECHISCVTNELSNDDNIEAAKSSSGTQIYDIRDYIPGDKLRNIHWKLSGKAQKLLVKEFCDSTEDSVIVLMELFTPALNSILTSGFSVANELIKYGQRVYLCWANAGDEQLQKFFTGSKEQLVDAFSAIFLSYPTNINTASLTALRREYDGRGIIYISGNENDNKAVIDIL